MCYIIQKVDGVYTPIKINGKTTHKFTFRTKKDAEAQIKKLNDIVDITETDSILNPNKNKEERIKKDREEANKSVTRQYRLKR